MRWFWCFLILMLLVFWSPESPALAQPSLTRLSLTPELLRDRVRHPLLRDGTPWIDLRQLEIDLRDTNRTLQEQFYTQLRARLLKADGALMGLDLSDSIIRGDLEQDRLGIRIPVFSQPDLATLSAQEQEQLARDRRRLSQLSRLSRTLLNDPDRLPQLDLTLIRGPLRLQRARITGRTRFVNTFFLEKLDATRARFEGGVDWSEARFSKPVSFAGAIFSSDLSFRSALFFASANWAGARFAGSVSFQGAEFQQSTSFARCYFQQATDWRRVRWQGNADFAGAQWLGPADFEASQFGQGAFFSDASFANLVSFRESQFAQPVNLRGAAIRSRADFSYALFAPGAYLNVSSLRFDPEQARIFGNPGEIGRHLQVPTLVGNDEVLRGLVRNFRDLEQIADANQIEYTSERLRAAKLWHQLVDVNINAATPQQLVSLGFNPVQVEAIMQSRRQAPFRKTTDLLNVREIDLAVIARLRNRLAVGEPLSWSQKLILALYWLWLQALLLLSEYGTDFWLAFGLGLLGLAYFALVFWAIDRLRLRASLPPASECIGVVSLASTLSTIALIIIFSRSATPGWMLDFCGLLTLPLPLWALLGTLRRPPPTALPEASYFVEDGSQRELHLQIGRLPIRPRFPWFRDRYLPLQLRNSWNWLNYFDLSLDNFFKISFNDLRLRDEQLPPLVALLVWYQWLLGLAYAVLLLWTLSRTIPGLNLFIYF
ncbi:pentapeptide repeat-containing protein [Leptolyngbya sp. FACHB-261]|uniref:pentapeptide repeat-containing protein n=1 Tax=Leptolyngbya sp. FACHB-261 TaxID=2692806 RepID=UPI001683FED7|nr:pentapeptide repeat-containing protein [Leptolyngbya sp. FACHB-261]MBD2102009.1 pentapeptide repeat-containing protein [Leptolyngbya sp. FACHB-261]